MDPSQITPSTPAIPPPPGVTSNFVNPHTRAPVAIIFISIAISLMWLVVMTRLYSKAWILRSFGWDDVCAIIAGALNTVFAGFVLYNMSNTLGPHGWDIQVIKFNEQYSRVNAMIRLFFPPVAFFAKLSIFLQYLRLFSPKKSFQYITYASIFVIFGFYTALTVVEGGQCIRRPGETWAENEVSPRCTWASRVSFWLIGTFGVVSNVFIYLLPLPVIWTLQMPLRRKLGVSFIFATGLLAIIASAFGLYYRVVINKQGKTGDVIWIIPPLLLVAVVELSLEIICGSMPALSSFYRHHTAGLSLRTSARGLISRYKARRSKYRDYSDTQSTYATSHPADGAIRVETEILGTIKGNGNFLKTSEFHDRWPQTPAKTDDVERSLPTRREAWEMKRMGDSGLMSPVSVKTDISKGRPAI